MVDGTQMAQMVNGTLMTRITLIYADVERDSGPRISGIARMVDGTRITQIGAD